MDNRIIGAIVAVVLLAIAIVYTLDGFGQGKTATIATAVVTNEQQFISKIEQDYTTAPDFTGLSNTSANSADETPHSMDGGGAVITNQFGGSVTVGVDAANSANFDITETEVPPSACVSMANVESDPVSVSINGTSMASSPPYTPAEVGPDCNKTGNSNTVLVVMGK